jgi:hypothetical protein
MAATQLGARGYVEVECSTGAAQRLLAATVMYRTMLSRQLCEPFAEGAVLEARRVVDSANRQSVLPTN